MTILFTIAILLSVSILSTTIWFFISRNMPSRLTPSGILVYHRVEDNFVAGSTWTTASRFKKQMEFLHNNNYKFVKLGDKTQNSNKKECIVTFDDGLMCLHNHAVQTLYKYNIPAIFFIVSDYIGKISKWDVYKQPHMGEEEIKELIANGCFIGSHTVTHPDLTQISSEKIKTELMKSKVDLEEKFNTEIEYLSYPFGRFDKRVQEIAQQCGYKGAVTINHPLHKTVNDNFAIPGNAVYFFDGTYNLRNKLQQNPFYTTELLKGKIMNRFASGTKLFVK